MILKYLLLVFLILTYSSCKTMLWEHVEIVSPDEKYVVTILTEGDLRYIIPESTSKIPKHNFALVDISKTDPIGDAIGICWDKDGYDIQILSLYSKFVQNTILDPNIKVHERLDNIDGGPNAVRYNRECCVSIMIRENSIFPKGGAILKYKFL